MNVLIVARPGMLLDGLSAMLSTMPEIKVVSVTNDLDSALIYVSEHHPKACIIDFSDLGDEQITQINRMKSISPDMKTIALVDELETKEVAESLGIDEVIIKGVPVEKLKNSIADFVQESNVDA